MKESECVKYPTFKTDVYAFACSLVLVSMFFIGVYSYETVITNSGIIEGKTGALVLLISAMAVVPVCYSAIKLIYSRFDRGFATSKRAVNSGFKKRRLIVLTGVIFACWLPYYIVRFPGNVDTDTILQLMQGYGIKLPSNHHPWFDTMIFTFFWKIGDVFGSNALSLALYGLLQSLLTATAFSVLICYVECLQGPRWLTRAIFIFVAFFPPVPLFAQAMTKDSLNGVFWILFLVCFAESLRTRGAAFQSKRYLIATLLTALLCCLTKKTCIIIIIPSMLVLISLCKNNRRASVCCLMITICMFSFWTYLILPLMNINSGTDRDLFSVPSQQTAYLIKQNRKQLGDDDWKVINSMFLDADDMSKDYISSVSDPVKDNHYNVEATTSDKVAFIAWIAKQSVLHPLTMMEAFTALCNPSIAITNVETSNNGCMLFYPDWFALWSDSMTEREQGFSSNSNGLASSEDVHALLQSAFKDRRFVIASNELESLYKHICKVFALLFSKALFATYLPLLMLVYAIREKNWLCLACFVPILLCMLSILFGPVAFQRYYIPIVYAAPLIISLPVILVPSKRIIENDLSST